MSVTPTRQPAKRSSQLTYRSSKLGSMSSVRGTRTHSLMCTMRLRQILRIKVRFCISQRH
jgi:hypothetical protein